jgi:hypothetical protein
MGILFADIASLSIATTPDSAVAMSQFCRISVLPRPEPCSLLARLGFILGHSQDTMRHAQCNPFWSFRQVVWERSLPLTVRVAPSPRFSETAAAGVIIWARMAPFLTQSAPARFLLFSTLCITLLAIACSNRESTAVRATVETFFGAIQSDNVPLIQDNLARDATPAFRDRVAAAAIAAQRNGDAESAVRVVRVDQPVVHDATASVHVNFADGISDDVSLVREGLRWKVRSSGRLR